MSSHATELAVYAKSSFSSSLVTPFLRDLAVSTVLLLVWKAVIISSQASTFSFLLATFPRFFVMYFIQSAPLEPHLATSEL